MGCLLKQGGGLYPRLRIGAVLLGAREGPRMGGLTKPLIRLQGVPLISRQLVALSGAGVDEVVVVTGHARSAPGTAEAESKFINPVCGMAVSTANPMHIEKYEGVSYYFCCDGCRTTFQKDPAKYAEIHHASMARQPA